MPMSPSPCDSCLALAASRPLHDPFHFTHGCRFCSCCHRFLFLFLHASRCHCFCSVRTVFSPRTLTLSPLQALQKYNRCRRFQHVAVSAPLELSLLLHCDCLEPKKKASFDFDRVISKRVPTQVHLIRLFAHVNLHSQVILCMLAYATYAGNGTFTGLFRQVKKMQVICVC